MRKTLVNVMAAVLVMAGLLLVMGAAGSEDFAALQGLPGPGLGVTMLRGMAGFVLFGLGYLVSKAGER